MTAPPPTPTCLRQLKVRNFRALHEVEFKDLTPLTVLLYDPLPPPFIGIEEPENFLHPRLLPELAEECRAASERTQLLVTTHSPFRPGCAADRNRVQGHGNWLTVSLSKSWRRGISAIGRRYEARIPACREQLQDAKDFVTQMRSSADPARHSSASLRNTATSRPACENWKQHEPSVPISIRAAVVRPVS